jgi:hypothetical protein
MSEGKINKGIYFKKGGGREKKEKYIRVITKILAARVL